MTTAKAPPRETRTKSAALCVLVLSLSAIGLAYAAAIVTGETGALSTWTMAIAIPFAMIATTVLGAARAGRPLGGLRRLVIPLLVLLVVLVGAFGAALLLPATGERLLLGLPFRAAIVLYGVGVLPVLILPVAYALTFDEITLTEEDIERVREAASRARSDR